MKRFLIILTAIFFFMNIEAKSEDGVASYYHDSLNGNLTANGEVYRSHIRSCAHKTLPFGTVLIVTNNENDKSVVVRVNDRGPFIEGRDIDLSRRAAESIQMVQRGVVSIKYTIVNDVIVKQFKSITRIIHVQ